MTFQRNHLYLTIHWKPSSYPLETGQCGIRFDQPTTVPTQTLVDACKSAVQTMWTAVGAKVPNTSLLTFLRLARIGTDGHYVPGSSSFDGTYASAIAGGGSSPVFPLQVAAATTLTTGIPHGQASKGRIFLPPLSVAPVFGGSDLWTDSDVTGRSTAVAAMITSLNTVLGGPAAVFSQGTVKGGGPLVRSVTGVYTGRRPDIQRRRAKGVLDTPGSPITVS